MQGFAQHYKRWVYERIEGELGVRHGRAIGELGYHGAMPMSELARELGVTPRYVTDIVDQLEQDGFAARVPHPADRRVTMVELTASGREVFVRGFELFHRLHAELLGALTPAEQASLCRCLETLLPRLGAAGCPPSAA